MLEVTHIKNGINLIEIIDQSDDMTNKTYGSKHVFCFCDWKYESTNEDNVTRRLEVEQKDDSSICKTWKCIFVL